MTQYGFYFDSSRCTGCSTCEMACKDFKDLSQNEAFRKIYDYEGGKCEQGADGTVTNTVFAYHVSAACNHCATPMCFNACTVGAIEIDEIGILRAAHPDAVDGIAPLADPSQTQPSLLINACPAAKGTDDTEGAITNEKSVTGVSAWE